MLFPTKKEQGSLEKYLLSSEASNKRHDGTRKLGRCGRPLRLCGKRIGHYRGLSPDGKYNKYPTPEQWTSKERSRNSDDLYKLSLEIGKLSTSCPNKLATGRFNYK